MITRFFVYFSLVIFSLYIPMEYTMIQYYNNQFKVYEDIDPLLLHALANIESDGQGFQNDRIKIRLENHILVARCETAKHTFKYNLSDTWRNHTFRSNDGTIKNSHTSQENEYEALAIANFLCSDYAYQSMSMGVFQLMGFHFKTIGFNSAKLMYEYMSESPEREMQVFSRFLLKNERLYTAFIEQDFMTIALIWNSQQPNFAERLESEYTTLKAAQN